MTGRRETWTCPACGAVNDGAVCRVDGALRVDLASAKRAGWRCPSCLRLNHAGDAECRDCGGPKPSSFGRVLEHLLWIIVPFIGAGGLTGLTGLTFLPLVISIGAVVAIVLGAVVLIGMSFARHAGHFESRSDAIMLVGLGLWLVAQALPAYTTAPYLGDEPNHVWGIAATLFDWMLFFFVPGFSGLLLAFAWSANVWLALAALARWHRPGWMLPFAVLAAVACAVGLGILIAGGVPEPGGDITEIGVGSWLWFSGMIVVLAGAAVRSAERFVSRSSPTMRSAGRRTS